MSLSLTVVVSTYNSPRYLALVLSGLACQVDADFECIVADDGSTEETVAVANGFSKRLRLKLVRQADRGFRLAANRNNALAMAEGDLVAFLDGDCIPAPHYTADAKRLFGAANDPVYVQGHRVILDDEISRVLTGEEALKDEGALTDTGGIFSVRWVITQRAHLGNPQNAFRYPWPRRAHQKLQGVRGCNMIFRAADLRALNGFDESFVGWGHEDQDMVRRLFRHGVRRVDARGKLVVYHLYHLEADRDASRDNLDRARAERPVVSAQGIRDIAASRR